MLEYGETGTIKDIFFKIKLNNQELPFSASGKSRASVSSLMGEKLEWEHTYYGEGWKQQAECIAWRICKTWLEAQITLINLE